MSTTEPTSATPTPQAHSAARDATIGASVLLSALAPWPVLYAVREAERTSSAYRERTDLDMPDWFAINAGVLAMLFAVGAVAGMCQFVAAGLFVGWASRVGWMMRVAYVALWLGVSALIVWALLQS